MNRGMIHKNEILRYRFGNFLELTRKGLKKERRMKALLLIFMFLSISEHGFSAPIFGNYRCYIIENYQSKESGAKLEIRENHVNFSGIQIAPEIVYMNWINDLSVSFRLNRPDSENYFLCDKVSSSADSELKTK